MLVLLALFVGGASYYVTDVRQEGEATRLRASRQNAELATARVADLRVQEQTSTAAAADARLRWQSRYRYIPSELATADVVEYLQETTQDAFVPFDIQLGGTDTTADYSTFSIEVRGTGEYEDLYHVIWHLENNRELYRVSGLTMRHAPDAAGDQVSFSFRIDAFYGDPSGLDDPEADLAPIPAGLLVSDTPQADIFAPFVRGPQPAVAPSVAELEAPASPAPAAEVRPAPEPPAETPPDGLDVERATLKLVVGDRAEFEDVFGRRFTVSAGDAVVGGTIEAVNATRGLVQARIGEGQARRIVVRTLGEAPVRR